MEVGRLGTTVDLEWLSTCYITFAPLVPTLPETPVEQWSNKRVTRQSVLPPHCLVTVRTDWRLAPWHKWSATHQRLKARKTPDSFLYAKHHSNHFMNPTCSMPKICSVLTSTPFSQEMDQRSGIWVLSFDEKIPNNLNLFKVASMSDNLEHFLNLQIPAMGEHRVSQQWANAGWANNNTCCLFWHQRCGHDCS